MAADTDVSATDIINNFLQTYQLQSLDTWAFDQLKQNKTWNEIHIAMQDTAEYRARFPVMKELQDAGRGISEGYYKSYEEAARSLSKQYNIPYEMYSTPEAIGKLLRNNVDPTVLAQRFNRAAYAAFQAPEEVRQGYANLYGLNSQGALISTYLDADKAQPILENMAGAAAVAGAAYRAGTSADLAEAQRLAAQGIDYNTAVQGYSQAQSQIGLDYAAGMSTTRADRVAAAFGDAEAQRRVQQAQEARQAAFQAGGGLAAGQQGVEGLSRAIA